MILFFYFLKRLMFPLQLPIIETRTAEPTAAVGVKDLLVSWNNKIILESTKLSPPKVDQKVNQKKSNINISWFERGLSSPSGLLQLRWGHKFFMFTRWSIFKTSTCYEWGWWILTHSMSSMYSEHVVLNEYLVNFVFVLIVSNCVQLKQTTTELRALFAPEGSESTWSAQISSKKVQSHRSDCSQGCDGTKRAMSLHLCTKTNGLPAPPQ